MTFDNSSLEKGTDAAVEVENGNGYHSEYLTDAQKKLDKKTVFRLDLIVVPMMMAIYLLAFLDRANIGNARVAGLQEDLHMTDVQYQTAITVTYVPYIAAELPSNLIFKRVGAKIMLPLMCFLWGLTTTLQSLVTNYIGLLVCRAFLGFFEGGMFPGIVLYLSGFYKPHEIQVRIGLFFSGAALSGAFSGILAAAIQKMDGIAHLRGWNWIFLLEGLFTVCFAVFAYWILPNTPHQVKSLNKEQQDWCEQRLRGPTSIQNESITLQGVLSTFKEPHVWVICITLFCHGCCLFGLAYFTPSIVATFGYSRTKTQLFSVPPFACAFFVTMVSAYCADRYRQRGLTAICNLGLAIVGFALFMTQSAPATKYAALCLMVTGVYAAAPSLISWMPNNVAAHSRRATAVAMAFMGTNLGGIVSTWIYPKTTAPKYTFAARFNVSLASIAIVLIACQVAWFKWKNVKKVRGDMDYLVEQLSEYSVAEQHDMLGDRHPEFRYTL